MYYHQYHLLIGYVAIAQKIKTRKSRTLRLMAIKVSGIFPKSHEAPSPPLADGGDVIFLVTCLFLKTRQM